MKHNKIAFIGMMGCGKSTIAKELANYSNMKLYELDEIFEKENKMKIVDFFKKSNQETFRKKEFEILNKIVKEDNIIISTGGGIILKKENRDILFKSNILTIYLKADYQTIYDRIKYDTSRPLLQVENPKEEIKKILLSREKYYNQANITINTDSKSVDVIKEELIELLWKE